MTNRHRRAPGRPLPATALFAAAAVAAALPSDTAHAAPPQLKVVGNQVQDAASGKPVRLRGVNAACLEWTSNGEGHILETVRRAIDDWKANVVRVPLSQDRWFGHGPEQKDGGKAYRALVKQIVELASSKNAYVLLDLHWSDENEWGKNIGQHKMPDENSLSFWKDFAPVYKNDPAVLFDLYNEPHDVTWDLWKDGGTVTEKDRKTGAETTYRAVGMRALLDAVRATGAKNVVVAGGLDWAYDLSGFASGKSTLADPTGYGVIYACHSYPIKGDTIARWTQKMEAATAKVPVIVSEFGAGGGMPARPGSPPPEQWVRETLDALESHGWHWTAWDLHPAAGPTLISDWSYTPTPYFGVLVKQALAGMLPPSAPATATAPAPPGP